VKAPARRSAEDPGRAEPPHEPAMANLPAMPTAAPSPIETMVA
jgi:hypothetical protein